MAGVDVDGDAEISTFLDDVRRSLFHHATVSWLEHSPRVVQGIEEYLHLTRPLPVASAPISGAPASGSPAGPAHSTSPLVSNTAVPPQSSFASPAALPSIEPVRTVRLGPALAAKFHRLLNAAQNTCPWLPAITDFQNIS